MADKKYEWAGGSKSLVAALRGFFRMSEPEPPAGPIKVSAFIPGRVLFKRQLWTQGVLFLDRDTGRWEKYWGIARSDDQTFHWTSDDLSLLAVRDLSGQSLNIKRHLFRVLVLRYGGDPPFEIAVPRADCELVMGWVGEN